MNTKNKQNEKSQQQRNRKEQRPKKRGQNADTLGSGARYQEHEHPESRLTR